MPSFSTKYTLMSLEKYNTSTISYNVSWNSRPIQTQFPATAGKTFPFFHINEYVVSMHQFYGEFQILKLEDIFALNSDCSI